MTDHLVHSIFWNMWNYYKYRVILGFSLFFGEKWSKIPYFNHSQSMPEKELSHLMHNIAEIVILPMTIMNGDRYIRSSRALLPFSTFSSEVHFECANESVCVCVLVRMKMINFECQFFSMKLCNAMNESAVKCLNFVQQNTRILLHLIMLLILYIYKSCASSMQQITTLIHLC